MFHRRSKIGADRLSRNTKPCRNNSLLAIRATPFTVTTRCTMSAAPAPASDKDPSRLARATPLVPAFLVPHARTARGGAPGRHGAAARAHHARGARKARAGLHALAPAFGCRGAAAGRRQRLRR